MSTALLIVVMYLGTGIQPLVHIAQEADMNSCHDARSSLIQKVATYNQTHPDEVLHHWIVLCLDISEMIRPRWKI